MTAPSGAYVPRREEEAAIRQQVEKVRADGTSRAVLVHGPGGAGKTMLVRSLAGRLRPEGTSVAWVKPIDVDDSEYWLLSNLETAVADALDPDRTYFEPYFDHLGRVARFAHEHVSYETVLAQLSRINRTFVDCYRTFARTSKTTVVITLDTIEAIRSMYLLLTLTQWMKELPQTLFVLSGRPPRDHEPNDPLRDELRDPHRPLEFVEVGLRGFADDEARRFLSSSAVNESLSARERDRLIDLTSRQPLWLALAVEYLQSADLPVEMTDGQSPSDATRKAFRRRLVTMYRSTDFWPEAIKRLAVVRHSVTQQVWSRLMADRELPPDATNWEEAWTLLLRRPWVRARANARYVTLHDALAEELAQRLIPLHDQDNAWRRELWHRAKEIYSALTSEQDEQVSAALAQIGEALDASDDGGEGLVAQVSLVDAQKRELDQLLTAQLHYTILDDFASGTDRFLELCQRAEDRRDPLFMELICHEMEKFLPREEANEPLEEVLDLAAASYRRWLQVDAPDRYVAIAVRIAGFLIRNEQSVAALELLSGLPTDAEIDSDLRYRLAIERGNASMRIGGRVNEARRHFLDALDQARQLGAEQERALREAEAHKELGFYYRNLGNWREADAAYRTARDVLAKIMGPGRPQKFREEMASIQTNWAYLKALRGAFREARNLIESAIAVRIRLGRRHAVGTSLSVSAEVFRYEGKFGRAWATYQEADAIFQETKSWPWLGLLYQEMAI
jgi:tetratricopeptide (TPR) repeat protein